MKHLAGFQSSQGFTDSQQAKTALPWYPRGPFIPIRPYSSPGDITKRPILAADCLGTATCSACPACHGAGREWLGPWTFLSVHGDHSRPRSRQFQRGTPSPFITNITNNKPIHSSDTKHNPS